MRNEIKFRIFLQPRSHGPFFPFLIEGGGSDIVKEYTQTYTPTVDRTRGGEKGKRGRGGVVATPPLGFCSVTIFGKYFI